MSLTSAKDTPLRMDNGSQQAQGQRLEQGASKGTYYNHREGVSEAMHSMPPFANAARQASHPEREYSRTNSPFGQRPSERPYERSSYASNIPLAGGAATPGTMTPVTSPDQRSSRYSARSIPLDDYPPNVPHGMMYGQYHDSPYQSSSLNQHPAVSDASIDPYNIADDGDDGFMPHPKRKTIMPLGKQNHKERNHNGHPVAAGAAGGGLGGLFGRKVKNQTSSGTYDPVSGPAAGSAGSQEEKSEWLSRQKKGKNKMRWVVGVVIGAVIVLAIVAGIVGGVLGSHVSNSNNSSGSGSTNNAETDSSENGDLDINSAEIKALMGNQNLHKVFPAIDYTPWGTQYPLCMTYPPSQNNVTRDMAVLSQLTNSVRLYGTDCNQTEMVLHAINKLELDDMKVWLGVWIDTNQTTTERQLSKMYEILEETSDRSIYKGAIIGNEALYRAGEDKAQSEQELISYLQDVRSQFKSKGYDLSVGTSDLGDNWSGELVQVSDFVMSNIHPFFAGVEVEVAAAWTWDFWQQHDVVLTETLPNVQQIISETGWPSGGGTDCGGTTGDCSPGQSGSVAGVDEMNTFMNDWVCQALANGTDYFW